MKPYPIFYVGDNWPGVAQQTPVPTQELDMLHYGSWREVADVASANAALEELLAEIEMKVPTVPKYVVAALKHPSADADSPLMIRGWVAVKAVYCTEDSK